MKPYPLLLSPTLKNYLWGGTKLKTDFPFTSDDDKAAEAWVLSCHADGPSIIQNGELCGQTLADAVALWGDECLGGTYERFPILIKLIDACDKLSIQVHPADEYAYRVEGEPGKTEMWYVGDCEPGAKLIYGFTKHLSKDEFRTRIEDNTLTEVCNFVPVKKGDVFFIEAGTLHAIGAGILIAEVQQNSNTTYRVSDYGRLGADGKPRALHIEQALDVTLAEPPQLPFGQIGDTVNIPGGMMRPLASCPLFAADWRHINGTMSFDFDGKFGSLLVLDGKGELRYDGVALPFAKGSSIFVPAGVAVEMVSQNAEILCSHA